MYYWKHKASGDDFLVLEPCDWTADEWKTLTKLFGCIEAERIVVRDYTLEVYGTPTSDLAVIEDFNDFNYEPIVFDIRNVSKEELKSRLEWDYINHLSRLDQANYFAIWNCDFQDFKEERDIYFSTDATTYALCELYVVDGEWRYKIKGARSVCDDMRMCR